MLKLIRFTWVTLLTLFLASSAVMLAFDDKHQPADFTYNKQYCTYYCEQFGCQHYRHLAKYHYLMSWQVRGLYRLGHSYELANLLVYWLAIAGFWLMALFYLLNLGKARYVWLESGLALLFSLLIAAQLLPDRVGVLFKASVFGCLFVSHQTGLSLYDVYIVMFGMLIPVITIGLLVLVGAKFLQSHYRPKRNSYKI